MFSQYLHWTLFFFVFVFCLCDFVVPVCLCIRAGFYIVIGHALLSRHVNKLKWIELNYWIGSGPYCRVRGTARRLRPGCHGGQAYVVSPTGSLEITILLYMRSVSKTETVIPKWSVGISHFRLLLSPYGPVLDCQQLWQLYNYKMASLRLLYVNWWIFCLLEQSVTIRRGNMYAYVDVSPYM